MLSSSIKFPRDTISNLITEFSSSNYCKLQHLVFFTSMCGSRKYPYHPHRGSRKFQGVEGCERGKCLKGRGYIKSFFLPEGLKCDRMKHLRTFPIGNQEKLKILSVEINVRFLVIYFALLFRRRTTHIELRDTTEQYVRREVKQNGC